jgi:hypothetical protein
MSSSDPSGMIKAIQYGLSNEVKIESLLNQKFKSAGYLIEKNARFRLASDSLSKLKKSANFRIEHPVTRKCCFLEVAIQEAKGNAGVDRVVRLMSKGIFRLIKADYPKAIKTPVFAIVSGPCLTVPMNTAYLRAFFEAYPNRLYLDTRGRRGLSEFLDTVVQTLGPVRV